MGNRNHSRKRFTLIELLTVVAILLILVAMLLPALTTAVERGKMVNCMGQEGQIGKGFLTFALDHNRQLPGSIASIGTEAWQEDWLGTEVFAQNATLEGTVFEYVGRQAEVYRCPSLPPGPVTAGVRSNGRFDYSAFILLAGARISNLNLNATVIRPITGVVDSVPMPMLVEEDPVTWINNGHDEGGHGNTDQIGRWHAEGTRGQYVAVDGSVHSIAFQVGMQAPTTYNWYAIAPSGTNTSLGLGAYVPFGYWNSR